MIPCSELRFRDPFVVPSPDNGFYYLVGSNGAGFSIWTSFDLEEWAEPVVAFSPPKGFWGQRDFWAPEIHHWRGRWYLFATMHGPDHRGTLILVADDIAGPYIPWSDGAVTPHDWMALDGTLYVDDTGDPWMVFCHEWVQVGNGKMCAVRLDEELRRAISEPVTLFCAADAPWVRPVRGPGTFVTDGPFMVHTPLGRLAMLWSSFGESGYSLAMAYSATGRIEGPWEHPEEPVYAGNGGHGMLFEDLQGQLRLAIHCPNKRPLERAVFFPVQWQKDALIISGSMA